MSVTFPIVGGQVIQGKHCNPYVLRAGEMTAAFQCSSCLLFWMHREPERTALCPEALPAVLLFTHAGLLSAQAILCRYNEESQKHTALSLSKEHNPTQYEERMRIQKAGGNVR